MIKYSEVSKKIRELKRMDKSIEEVLEIIEIVMQCERVRIMDMELVMEIALDLGEHQDWFEFSEDEIRIWRGKAKRMGIECKDREEIKCTMMEFKKSIKVKREGALETREEIEEIERVVIEGFRKEIEEKVEEKLKEKYKETVVGKNWETSRSV